MIEKYFYLVVFILETRIDWLHFYFNVFTRHNV